MNNLIYSILKAKNEARNNGRKGPFSYTIGMESYGEFLRAIEGYSSLVAQRPSYLEQVGQGVFYAGKVHDVSIFVVETQASQELKESLILEQYERQLKQETE